MFDLADDYDYAIKPLLNSGIMGANSSKSLAICLCGPPPLDMCKAVDYS
jgi:hypothetical protein